MAPIPQCCVCRLDSSHYIEHFACVDFTEFLFLPYSFNRTGLSLGLIVFGLGLTSHVWSRSRSRSRSHSLWSWSQSRSHCVVVSLTSLDWLCVFVKLINSKTQSLTVGFIVSDIQAKAPVSYEIERSRVVQRHIRIRIMCRTVYPNCVESSPIL